MINVANVLEVLKSIDLTSLSSADLVPLVKQVQAIGAYAEAIDAEIQRRAIGNGEMLPGVVVKDAIVHRKWHDQDAAEQLAREAFGDAAFETKLKSPAGMEKMGEKGRQFVAVASYKPEAGKRVVY